MEIRIQTKVAQNKDQVMEGFTKDLFLKLKPPLVGLKLLQFDGSETGDIVHLELNFHLFKTQWKSRITDHANTKELNYFIDEGIEGELPFFLKTWKHQHRVLADGEASIIEDLIEFTAPNILLAPFLYPSMYLQFLARRPIYQKVFGKR